MERAKSDKVNSGFRKIKSCSNSLFSASENGWLFGASVVVESMATLSMLSLLITSSNGYVLSIE